MPEISYQDVRKRVLAATLDEMRGFNDWDEFSCKLTDTIALLISTYRFSRHVFNKEIRKIRTNFFRDNNLKKRDFFQRLFQRFEILDETLISQEISLNKIKNIRKIPRRIKIIVFKRDKGKCSNCKKLGIGGLMYKINYDHDYPFSRNGTSLTPANVRLLCLKCNLKKSDKIE